MHALILRRVVVIEAGVPAAGPDWPRIQSGRDSSARFSGPPMRTRINCSTRKRMRTQLRRGSRVQQYAPTPADLPLAVCPKGTILKNPERGRIGTRAWNGVPFDGQDQPYDVAVVEAGPARPLDGGLCGLPKVSRSSSSTRAPSVDEASASARIENYLGFPAGDFRPGAGRPRPCPRRKNSSQDGDTRRSDSSRSDRRSAALRSASMTVGASRAQTVVVATGAFISAGSTFQTLRISRDTGIWYWASPIKAALRLCRDEEIVLVGMAATRPARPWSFLRNFAKKSGCWCSGPSLAGSMSQYLHRSHLRDRNNIEVLTRTEIIALYGSREKQLERVRWRSNVTGEEAEKPIRHIFLFIGADPATTWLGDSGELPWTPRTSF